MGSTSTQTSTTKNNNPALQNYAVGSWQNTQNPSALENTFGTHAAGYQDAANQARDTNMKDYGSIMQGYQDFANGLGGPTKFSYQKVNADRPAELNESYGYLREAAPGYRDFAATGGYSPTDIQELRARGISPIRSSYGNTMREMDRARALGGGGGAPNYIAAASKAQREMPGQMADAMTTVNAGLAEQIRNGKLAGLAGLTGIGGTMGGLSNAEANRILQAAMSNQSADIQTQGMGEQSLQALRQAKLASLGGQTSLYGTTPAMSATFGNQALNAYNTMFNAQNARQQLGQGYLGQAGNFSGTTTTQENKVPWWQQALGAAGSAANILGNMKTGGNQTSGQNGQGTPGPNNPNSMWYNQYGDSYGQFGPGGNTPNQGGGIDQGWWNDANANPGGYGDSSGWVPGYDFGDIYGSPSAGGYSDSPYYNYWAPTNTYNGGGFTGWADNG